MYEILSIFFIGIALSMDAFSISLGIGTLPLTKKKHLQITLTVGLFHFIMPLLGILISNKLILALHIESHIIMSGILLLIAFEMLKSSSKEEEIKINLNLLGIIGFALTVSLDAFSTGIGLGGINFNIFFSSFIFSLCSMFFTFIGLKVGEKAQHFLGKYATLLGALILLIIALRHFIM